jgi:phage terminase Nu1 subunit (DNA packaging protein)
MAEKTKRNTQAEFAKLVGITQQAVSQLIRKGVLSAHGNLVQWIGEYCANLRDQAAGRKSESGKFDLVDERARLAASQREKIDIEIARLRAELVPLVMVGDILSHHSSTVRSHVLGAANALKAKHPETSTAQFVSLNQIHNDLLTALSYVKFPADLDERIKSYFRDIQAAPKSNGNGMGG